MGGGLGYSSVFMCSRSVMVMLFSLSTRLLCRVVICSNMPLVSCAGSSMGVPFSFVVLSPWRLVPSWMVICSKLDVVCSIFSI